MLHSMTAFARASHQAAWGMAIWEIRSVNHRYLDINFRLPENLHEAEFNWRKTIQAFVQRGKIDCQLTFFPAETHAPKLQANQELVQQLIEQSIQIRKLSPHIVVELPALEVLNWPGVITTTQTLNTSSLIPEFTSLLQDALTQLVNMRQREGLEIAKMLEAKLDVLLEMVEAAKPRVPESLNRQKQKLLGRLEELQQSESERIEQEMVILANKWDVVEELDRLQCHYQEVKKCLQAQDPNGRRLDFLMQEMNREANTLASKSQDAILSKIAVDLKVLIEQMREQIQNVE